MLNWIAIWFAYYAYQIGGPLQDPSQANTDVSRTVASSAKLPVFWGSPVLEGLDVGIFIALALAAVYWLLIKRTRLGFEARTVGFNPEAARYSGINVERTWIRVMMISGAFAGVAAALDMLGWKFYLYQSDILVSQIGFYGIAVALLGRNNPGGIVAAAIFLGALFTGTASRNFPSGVIDPQLVPQLTFIIEGLIIVLVSTDVVTLKLLKGGRRAGRVFRGRPRRGPGDATTAGESAPTGSGQ
jgi:ABC-type uncharacterized transport system permease subunit